jgi:hypothetical protein
LLGKCCLTVESTEKRAISTFYVINGKARSLLGDETAAGLGNFKIKVNEVFKFSTKKATGNQVQSEPKTGSQSSGSGMCTNSPNNAGNREIQDKNNTENMHDINTQKI